MLGCIQIALLAMYIHDDLEALILDYDNVIVCQSKEDQDLFREFFKSDFVIKVVGGVPVYPESFLAAIHEINNQGVAVSVRVWLFSMIESLVQQGYFYDEAHKAAVKCLHDGSCDIKIAALKVLLHLAKKGKANDSILIAIQHCFNDQNKDVRLHTLNLFSVLAQPSDSLVS